MENSRIPFSEKHVLLDIEGTTTSIKFVKDVLFPYARNNLVKYINENWGTGELQTVVDLLKKQCVEDLANKVEGVIAIVEGEHEKTSIIENLCWQMDLDRKTNALKRLQGFIWRNGYYSGEIKSHIYEDVEPALQLWKKNGKLLYIYSSGSVEAQKLLFGFTKMGNMLELFSGHFDTDVGPKVEFSSYLKIADAIGCPANDILFVTDVIQEANAASQAGCAVIISERPGNIPLSNDDRNKFKCIRSFDELLPVPKTI